MKDEEADVERGEREGRGLTRGDDSTECSEKALLAAIDALSSLLQRRIGRSPPQRWIM